MTTDHDKQRPGAPMFETLHGQRIPGGCDDCDAYQTLEADPELSGLTHLTVHHDDTCPNLRQHDS